jgi:hypothetical protein
LIFEQRSKESKGADQDRILLKKLPGGRNRKRPWHVLAPAKSLPGTGTGNEALPNLSLKWKNTEE